MVKHSKDTRDSTGGVAVRTHARFSRGVGLALAFASMAAAECALAAPELRSAPGVPRVLSGLPILKAQGVEPPESKEPPRSLKFKPGEALIKRINQFALPDYQPSAEAPFTISPRNPVGPHASP